MPCINPTTEETFDSPPDFTADQIESSLARAATAFESWRTTPIAERGRLMKAVATVLRRDRDRLTKLMAHEMGKPLAGGEQEIEKCAWSCDYFADHAAKLLASETIATDAAHSYVRYDPLGAVLAIMPWNFPFWQVFRFAAPTLMAGNVALLKHAPNVPQCALAIERLFVEEGFPEGVFQTLFIDIDQVRTVVADRRIGAVTLTGSE